MSDLPRTLAQSAAGEVVGQTHAPQALPHLSQDPQSISSAAPASEPVPAGRHGQFRILRPHARGGLGQISLALDETLGRTVAIKEIRPDLAHSAYTRRRFVQEAEVTGQLEHPNIVPIYALGQDEHGRPYYAMRFVDGRTLEQLIADYHVAPTPLVFQDLLRRCVAVCQAMAYAHSEGIIHRDLKPANIITGRYGETLILDWGLAKRLDDHEKRTSDLPEAVQHDLPALSSGGLTLEGHALGTPAYMAPEQADASGGTLSTAADIYALGAILYQILTGRPPHQGNSRTEVLARAACGDVPRPSSLHSNVPRALEAVCLKALSPLPDARYASAEEMAQETERFLAGEPVNAYREPLLARCARWGRRHKHWVAGIAAVLLLSAVGLAIATAVIATEQERTRAALVQSQQHLEIARRNERLAAERLHEGLVLSGDGLLAMKQFGQARQHYGQAVELARQLGLGETAGIAGIVACNAISSPPLADLSGHRGTITGVRFLPDNRHAVSCARDRMIILWDLVSGIPVRTFEGHDEPIHAMAISLDGTLLATASEDRTVKLWELPSGREILTLTGHEDPLSAVAFSPDGQTLVSASQQGNMRLWDVRTGDAIWSRAVHHSYIYSVAVSPDGKLIASGSGDRVVRLCTLETGETVGPPLAHEGNAVGVAFSPDGTTLATACADMLARIWDVATAQEVMRFSGHVSNLAGIAFGADGTQLVTISKDSTLRVWEAASGREVALFTTPPGGVRAVDVSSDGRFALAAGANHALLLWNLQDRSDVPVLPGDFSRLHNLVLGLDGQVLLSGTQSQFRLWDTATGKLLRVYPQRGSLARSSDLRRVFTSSADGLLSLWDLVDDRHITTFQGHTKRVTAAMLLPDRKRAISASWDGTLKLWDLQAGEQIRSYEGHEGHVLSLELSPDGARVASCGTDRTVRLWDIETGESVHVLRDHGTWVMTVTFSPDGKRLLSAGWDGTMRIWDVDSGAPLLRATNSGSFLDARFAPHGRLIVSTQQSSGVTLWDALTGKKIRTLDGHSHWTTAVAWAPDGMRLFSASRDTTIRCWDLGRPQRYDEFNQRLVEARLMLASRADHPTALRALGEWYAFRGVNDWAAESLERARTGGADVSPLMLARCYWRLERLDDARREFQHALQRSEATSEYLNLCISAIEQASQ